MAVPASTSPTPPASDLEETTAAAVKRVIAWQLREAMAAEHLSKEAHELNA